MAIYHVNEKGEKIDPEQAPPLSQVFVVNENDKDKGEAFLKTLKGDVEGNGGVVRMNGDAEPPQDIPLTKSADVPEAETARRGRPPSTPLR